MVRILFLGVGGWISEPFLGFTSILIKTNNMSILIDAGECVYKAIRRCGYDIDNINAVVLTHGHGDHILGIPTLAIMASHKGLKSIRVISMKSVIDSIKLLFNIVGIPHILNTIEFIEILPENAIQLEYFRLSFIEALHSVPAISVKIGIEDKCIVFSGDTRYNPRLAEFAKNCNVLIHEVSSYTSNAYIYGHSSYIEALDIASKANVDIFIPIHFYKQAIPIDITYLHNKPKLYIPTPCSYIDL